MTRAISDPERGLGAQRLSVDDDARAAIVRFANGDARIALNLLDLAAAGLGSDERITAALVADLAQNRALLYDKTGEEHYNLISALHKSMRNSDPDASVYWLARMLEAGEDPLYVARRLVRFASEDVGNADPQALSVAVAAKDAVHFIGMPEGNTALAQAAIHLANAPKSNAVLVVLHGSRRGRGQGGGRAGPLHLRNAPTGLMKQLEYGKGYRYAHDEPEGVADMECLLPAHRGRKFSARSADRPKYLSESRPHRDGESGAGGRKQPLSVQVADLPEHLRPKRKNEREPVVALHPADRNPDQFAFAVEHAAARHAGMPVGQARHQLVDVRCPTYPVDRMMPLE